MGGCSNVASRWASSRPRTANGLLSELSLRYPLGRHQLNVKRRCGVMFRVRDGIALEPCHLSSWLPTIGNEQVRPNLCQAFELAQCYMYQHASRRTDIIMCLTLLQQCDWRYLHLQQQEAAPSSECALRSRTHTTRSTTTTDGAFTDYHGTAINVAELNPTLT